MYQGTVTSASVRLFIGPAACVQNFKGRVFDDDGTETVQQCVHVQSWKVFMDKHPHPAGKVTGI